MSAPKIKIAGIPTKSERLALELANLKKEQGDIALEREVIAMRKAVQADRASLERERNPPPPPPQPRGASEGGPEGGPDVTDLPKKLVLSDRKVTSVGQGNKEKVEYQANGVMLSENTIAAIAATLAREAATNKAVKMQIGLHCETAKQPREVVCGLLTAKDIEVALYQVLRDAKGDGSGGTWQLMFVTLVRAASK